LPALTGRRRVGAVQSGRISGKQGGTAEIVLSVLVPLGEQGLFYCFQKGEIPMYAPGRRWRPQQEPANPSNNHFNFKKEYFIMKKVISLVLSVMMMLTMFAGCKASGTAFRFMFMGAHMAVENHGEGIGEFLQRRVNFIVSALGSINPTEFSKASQTIDIETELVPYMIDDLNDKVTTAVSAVSGGIWSTREGIMFAGNADRVEEELAEIKEEQAAKNEQIGDKGKKNAS